LQSSFLVTGSEQPVVGRSAVNQRPLRPSLKRRIFLRSSALSDFLRSSYHARFDAQVIAGRGVEPQHRDDAERVFHNTDDCNRSAFGAFAGPVYAQ